MHDPSSEPLHMMTQTTESASGQYRHKESGGTVIPVRGDSWIKGEMSMSRLIVWSVVVITVTIGGNGISICASEVDNGEGRNRSPAATSASGDSR